MKNLKIILLGIIVLVQVSLISAMSKKSQEQPEEPLYARIAKEKAKQFNRLFDELKEEIKKEIFNQTGLYSVLADMVLDYAETDVLMANKILLYAAETLDYGLMVMAIYKGVNVQGVQSACKIINNIKDNYSKGLYGNGYNIGQDDLKIVNRCDEMLKRLKKGYWLSSYIK